MKRKTSTIPTRIYSYGALAPTEQREEVERQLRQQAKYYNCLVQLENLRRAVFEGLELDYGGEIRVAQAALDLLNESCKSNAQAIADERKSSRSRTVSRVLITERTRLREARKSANECLREAKRRHRAQFELADTEFDKRVLSLKESTGMSGPNAISRFNADVLEKMLTEDWPIAWKQLQRVESIILQAKKDARALSGIPHGTYVLAEMALESARQKQRAGDIDRKWIPRDDEPCVDDSGRVGIQLTPGITVAELIAGNDSRLRLDVDTFRPDGCGKNWAKNNTRATVSVRLGYDTERNAIFARIPILYHRTLPPDAIIKWVWLSARREGRRIRYEFQFTNESESYVDRGNAQRAECCAINLGWRFFDDHVRVGYVVGSDGWKQEIRLDFSPAKQPDQKTESRGVIERLRYCAELNAICDKHFDITRAIVTRHIATNEGPDWLRAECATIAQWKSHDRLARFSFKVAGVDLFDVWKSWKSERLAAKLDLFDSFDVISAWATDRQLDALAVYLDFWRRKDAHLRTMAQDIRTRASANRDDIYSLWAKKLSERYQIIVHEDENLKRTAKIDETDEKTAQFRNLRSMAAPGRLKETIAQKVGKSRMYKVDSEWNSVTCNRVERHANGTPFINASHESDKFHRMTCEACLSEHDIDELNCQNQLRRYFERSSDEKTPGVARDSKIGNDSHGEAAE